MQSRHGAIPSAEAAFQGTGKSPANSPHNLRSWAPWALCFQASFSKEKMNNSKLKKKKMESGIGCHLKKEGHHLKKITLTYRMIDKFYLLFFSPCFKDTKMICLLRSR